MSSEEEMLKLHMEQDKINFDRLELALARLTEQVSTLAAQVLALTAEYRASHTHWIQQRADLDKRVGVLELEARESATDRALINQKLALPVSVVSFVLALIAAYPVLSELFGGK